MPPHYQDSSVTVHKITCGPYGNNAYLVVCPRTNESILIDTPADPGKLIEAARQTNVKAILITHNHFDHIQGFEEVTSAIKAPVGIGEADAHALPRQPDLLLKDGDEIKAGTVTLKAISTPGHTPGSTCLSFGKVLFTGDTLFPGGPGKTRAPENLRQIIQSITSRLFPLGDDIGVFPGHGDDTTLKASKEEYAVFASKSHPADLCGDVLWLES
ncbi:MAG: MBL fold metallo-hydrolase [Chloroflexi bacterium]|nr:MBL fold metallo-hydrolase [Chloroflexota bacterium]